MCGVLLNIRYKWLLFTTPLPSARQHPSYCDCLEVKREYYQNSLCWIVWHNVHSQQRTYMSSSHRSNRLGLSHWDSYAVRRRCCLSCIIVTWWSGSGWIQAWSRRPTGFLLCFDTVGLVIWPVEIVPKMTYNALSGTLSLYTTTSHRVAS